MTPEQLSRIVLRAQGEYWKALEEGRNAQHWWLYRRVLPDGRAVILWPLGGGMLQLGVSPTARAPWYDHTWYFKNHDAAWRAAILWEPPPFLYAPGPDEPDGWYRHPQSGRRRDAGREYIQW